MQFFANTNINFVGKRNSFFLASSVILVIGVILIFTLGIIYGIDFVGGTEIQVKFDKAVNTEEIRRTVEGAGITGSEIKSYGAENQYIIRVKEYDIVSETAEQGKVKISDQIEQILIAGFPDNVIEKLGENTIGPKIGKELRTDAFMAVGFAILALLIYIAFRFEFVFGLGAIVALVHDVIFTFSVVVVLQNLGIMNLEINQAILAAMLTVVGYSINDTVIVFDRIRENREKQKGIAFAKLVNNSINDVLSRTVNTTLTVVMVLLIMVIFAGPVLQGFAFTMFIGIIIGTYSSIYIASSFVIWYMGKFKHLKVESDSTDTKKAATAKA